MNDRERLPRLATSLSIGVAAGLALLKLSAAVLTGSVGLMALLIDSVADLAASLVTFLAVRIAQQPPDAGHRFGHGKAEPLAALLQAALVLGSAAVVLIEAGRRLVRPAALERDTLGIAVVLVSLVVTVALVLFQRHVVRRTSSMAVRADRLHYTSDILANLAVLASLVVTSRVGVTWLDPLIGGLIAALLLRSALKIARTGTGELMDRELPTEDRKKITALVLAHPEVEGLHDLRSRQAAGRRFIEFHIEIAGSMTVRDAHKVTDALEDELEAAFPGVAVIIHQEPAGIADVRLDHLIESGG